MLNISFDFDENTRKVTNFQVIDFSKKLEVPDVQILDNKLVITSEAINKLNATVGDRLSINYWTVDNKTTYPIISKSEVFTDGSDGSKLTKARTLSFRGQQRETLLKFGYAFNFEEFVDRSGKVKPFVFKLVPVSKEIEPVDELVDAETQLDDMNQPEIEDEIAKLLEGDDKYLPF